MAVSIFTVDEHFWSPAARQRTATHCAIENRACFATPPPDLDDGLAVNRSESKRSSKLVFAEYTSAAKKLCKACNTGRGHQKKSQM